ncbi:serine/threonine protein phosphatase [Streptomyces bikiniensis]|uniref:serine/threonine protein phosphatase n=1 Tax=Streptomyces bikiniensis TaxID=1896 RepID=UPI000A8FA10C|nr:serine/threonine protein phosphatase [Streptomyces bikiniensis]
MAAKRSNEPKEPQESQEPQEPKRPGKAEEPAGRVPPRQAVWTPDQKYKSLQTLSVWTEQVSGLGEDAEPFVVHHLETQQGMIAVFDGSGGAGATPTWQGPDGAWHTGAWVGSRVARLAVDCWFREVALGNEEAVPESLHLYLRWFLSKAPQRHSKIGGTMRRRLPTTLAAVHYRFHADYSRVELRPLWAGDSRAYVLSPTSGLHVLTRDHTRESDALELLRTDPPMTNVVCADREFTIDTQHLASFALPCVLVAATDGYFGYVHTPADFEHLLLSTLREAHNEYEWADLLRREVQAYTGDDASLALLALGHKDFAHLRSSYERRFADLTERYVRGRPGVLDRAPRAGSEGPRSQEGEREDHARVRAWQDQSWRTYRAGYETYLPSAAEEHR